jgi:hypothetical protein
LLESLFGRSDWIQRKGKKRGRKAGANNAEHKMRPPRQLDAATISPVADGVEDMTAIAATTSMPRQNRD